MAIAEWVDHVKSYFNPGDGPYDILDMIIDAERLGIEVRRTGVFVDGDGLAFILNFK